MKHVLSSFAEIILAREGGKRSFFREEINFEYIAVVHRVREVALPTTVMFKQGTNVPADFTVFAEGGASVG